MQASLPAAALAFALPSPAPAQGHARTGRAPRSAQNCDLPPRGRNLAMPADAGGIAFKNGGSGAVPRLDMPAPAGMRLFGIPAGDGFRLIPRRVDGTLTASLPAGESLGPVSDRPITLFAHCGETE